LLAPLAVKFTEAPAQITEDDAFATTVGLGVTPILIVLVELQPNELPVIV
jgi:hypothetical protein